MREMFERIGTVMTDHGYAPEQCMMKIAWYRNYNCDKDRIFGQSEWQHRSADLVQYLSTFDADYGWGEEAIEVGLERAIAEIEEDGGLSQILLIGDAGCNTESDMEYK